MVDAGCLLEICRKPGNITKEPIIRSNQRPSGKARLDGDEHVISVDGQCLAPEVLQAEEFSPSARGVGLRKDTPMKQMPLIKGEDIPVPDEFKSRLPRVSPVEEITEIGCPFPQVWGFQQAIDDRSILSEN